MARHRTDMHRLHELVRLHRLGRTARKVARLLGMGRSTLSAYAKALGAAGLLEGEAGALPSPPLGRVGRRLAEHSPEGGAQRWVDLYARLAEVAW